MKTGDEVNGTGSGSCSMVDYGFSDIEPLGSSTILLVTYSCSHFNYLGKPHTISLQT
jgi:hypothetical protein